MKKLNVFKFKKPINLYCFTDVHIGSKAHDSVKFNKIINLLKKDKNGYCFFNGDNLEFTPGGHHGATDEQNLSIDEQIDNFTKLIKSLGKKILFFRTGNHEARAMDLCAVDVYKHLSRELKVPQLERGMEEVHIKINNSKYRLVSSHGEGGNSKRAINNMQLTFPGADIYFTGHTHELYCNSGNKNIDTSLGVEQLRGQLEICGGSFMNWAAYARDKNMRPTETGCFMLHLNNDGIFEKVLK